MNNKNYKNNKNRRHGLSDVPLIPPHERDGSVLKWSMGSSSITRSMEDDYITFYSEGELVSTVSLDSALAMGSKLYHDNDGEQSEWGKIISSAASFNRKVR